MATILPFNQPYVKPAKRFAWSWSKYKNFRICPKRHYETDIAKNYSDDGSEAVTWGKDLHTAMQKRIDFGIPLPATMARYEDWPARIVAIREAGIKVACEQKLAIDDEFRPTSYFDAATWLRVVVDVLMLAPPYSFAIDWKTGGEIKPEMEQLALTAQVLFAHHPELTEVASIYVWIGHDTQTVRVYRREDMTQMWSNVMPTVLQMQNAHNTMTYPPNPGGMCKRWCQVVSCPYHGKGTF